MQQASADNYPISTLIVDDEALARNLIATFVRRDADLLLVGECGNGIDALEMIHEKKPDLVFLDIQMPLLDGISVTERLASLPHAPHVIFVTAFAAHAVQAFELDALDYLVKPLQKARFGAAVERAKRSIRAGEMVALTERLLALSRGRTRADHTSGDDVELTVRVGDTLVRLTGDDILWVEAANQYVEVHTRERSYTVSESLSRYARRLSDGRFFRIHRSALVNAEAVGRVERCSNGTHCLTLHDGRQLTVARSRARLIPAILRAARGASDRA